MRPDAIDWDILDILQDEGQQQITIERIQRKVTEMYDIRMSDMQNWLSQ